MTIQAQLMGACQRGDASETASILDSRADVNAYGAGGVSVLHLACMRGHGACARVLLEHGAAVDLATACWDWDKVA